MAKPREEWGDHKLYRAICEVMNGKLFHLTDWAHVASIQELGLLSKCEANVRGVYPAYPGGNNLTRALDDQRGLRDYVFLAFDRSGVMPKDREQERQRRPLILHIDPNIVFEPGVRVSVGRSTRSLNFSTMRAFYEMDWQIMLFPELRTGVGGPARWKSFLDYEILVPKCVPPHFIIGYDT